MTLKSFLTNTLSNYSLLFLKLLYTVIAMPICLRLYGEDLYGIYLLCFSLSASLGFFDFGSGKSLLRYTAEYLSDQDHKKFESVLSNNISLNIVAALLAFFVLLFAGMCATDLFHISANLKDETTLLFTISACNAIVVFLGLVPYNMLTGMSRFHSRNRLQLIPILLSYSTLLYMVFIGPISIILFSLITFGLSILAAALDYFLLARSKLLKHVSISLSIKASSFRNQHFSYTKSIFLLSAIGFLGVQTDRLIIAGFRDVGQVTTYTLITRPYFLLKALFTNIYIVVQPLFIKLSAEKNDPQLHLLLKKYITSTSLILFCCVAILIIFFEQALQLWLGTNDYNIYAKWGILALVNICIPALYAPIIRVLSLTDHARFLARTNIYLILLNVCASVILTMYFGFYGVIIGTTVQMVAEYLLISFVGSKRIRLKTISIYNINFLWSVLIIAIVTILARLLVIHEYTSLLFTAILTLVIIVGFGYIVVRYFRKESILTMFQPL